MFICVVWLLHKIQSVFMLIFNYFHLCFLYHENDNNVKVGQAIEGDAHPGNTCFYVQ